MFFYPNTRIDIRLIVVKHDEFCRTETDKLRRIKKNARRTYEHFIFFI